MAKQTVTERRQETVDKAEELMSEALDLLEGLWQELDDIRSNLELIGKTETEKYQRLEELVDVLDASKTELESARYSLPMCRFRVMIYSSR